MKPRNNECIFNATKDKQIDNDNFRLNISFHFAKGLYDGKVFETIMQYNMRTNTVHHNDSKFESLAQTIGVDVDQIAEDIEKRKIQIQ